MLVICTKCKLPKSESEFAKDSRKRNGLRSACQVCRDGSRAKYRENIITLPAVNVLPEKRCASCELVRPIDWFTINNQALDKRSWTCRSCLAVRTGIRVSLKKGFAPPNITIKQAAAMDWSRCAFPGCPRTERLSLDHDHKTGRVRGILCYVHNSALGWLEKIIIPNLEFIRSYLAT